MSKNHKSVDQMRPNETSAASYQDALALGRRKELDRGETGEGGVRDRLGVSEVDCLGQVGVCFIVFISLLGCLARGRHGLHVVRPQV